MPGSTPPTLAQLRAEHARASRAAKAHPSPDTRRHAEQLRARYAEEKLAAYIIAVVAAAPPLTPSQRDRLATLLAPAGSR